MPVGVGGYGDRRYGRVRMGRGGTGREAQSKGWARDAAQARQMGRSGGRAGPGPSRQRWAVVGTEPCRDPGAEVPNLHPLLSRELGGHPPCLFTAGPQGHPGHRKRFLCTHRKLRAKPSADTMTTTKTEGPCLKYFIP